MLGPLKKVLLPILTRIAAAYQTVTAFPAYWTYWTHGRQLVHFESPLSGNIAIFASFQRKASPALLSHLRDLQNHGYRTVFVSNIPLSPNFIEAIRPFVATCIERPNIARDFGAYRCGILHVFECCEGNAGNILLTNDTIVFPLIDSSHFWQETNKLDGQVIGAFESFSPQYHLQSFFIIIKPEIHGTDYFKYYWTNYKLWNSRSHAITHGEIGFSSMLLRNGVKLKSYINVNETPEYIQALIKTDHSKWLTLDKNLSAYIDNIDKPHLSQIYLQKAVGNLLEASNPSHSFAFPAISIKRVPLIKKDLVSRGSYRLAEVLDKIHNIAPEVDLSAVANEMRQKRLPSEQTQKEKFMDRLGMR